MENKKTTELLDLLKSLTDENGEIKDMKKYELVENELKQREPFFQIMNESWEESLPALWEVVKEMQEEIKKLKRHKHDTNSGDVMVRM